MSEMLKVKTFRQSGLPVDLDQFDAFDKEWKDGYDAIMEKFGRDMQKIHEHTEMLQEQLNAKYDTVTEWDFMADSHDLLRAVEKYGPIITATHKETGELLYIIADQGL